MALLGRPAMDRAPPPARHLSVHRSRWRDQPGWGQWKRLQDPPARHRPSPVDPVARGRHGANQTSPGEPGPDGHNRQSVTRLWPQRAPGPAARYAAPARWLPDPYDGILPTHARTRLR